MCFAYFFALDYKLDHELLRVGCRFRFQRGAEIPVSGSSINKMLKLHATDEAVPVTPSIQLVEVTVLESSENYTKGVAAVSSFCEYLAQLSAFVKIRHLNWCCSYCCRCRCISYVRWWEYHFVVVFS